MVCLDVNTSTTGRGPERNDQLYWRSFSNFQLSRLADHTIEASSGQKGLKHKIERVNQSTSIKLQRQLNMINSWVERTWDTYTQLIGQRKLQQTTFVASVVSQQAMLLLGGRHRKSIFCRVLPAFFPLLSPCVYTSQPLWVHSSLFILPNWIGVDGCCQQWEIWIWFAWDSHTQSRAVEPPLRLNMKQIFSLSLSCSLPSSSNLLTESSWRFSAVCWMW